MSLYFIPFHDTRYTLPSPGVDKHRSGRQRNKILVDVCRETKLGAEVHAFSLFFKLLLMFPQIKALSTTQGRGLLDKMCDMNAKAGKRIIWICIPCIRGYLSTGAASQSLLQNLAQVHCLFIQHPQSPYTDTDLRKESVI